MRKSNRLDLILASSLLLALSACSGSGTGVPDGGAAGDVGGDLLDELAMTGVDGGLADPVGNVGSDVPVVPAGAGGLTDVFGDPASPNGPVQLDARVRIWSDTMLTVDYTLTHTGLGELIVFDVGFTTSTALDDETGRVAVLQAKRDTGGVSFERPPTIGGRNLSPGQTIDGSANRMLPINVDFVSPLVSGLTPETIDFCVGFGDADIFIPATLTDGTYALNEDLESQTLVCTPLDRQ